MYWKARGRMLRADSDDHDPVYELMIAVVKRAQRDMESPVRRRDSTSAKFPSAEEKEEARQFLSWCVEEFSARLS